MEASGGFHADSTRSSTPRTSSSLGRRTTWAQRVGPSLSDGWTRRPSAARTTHPINTSCAQPIPTQRRSCPPQAHPHPWRTVRTRALCLILRAPIPPRSVSIAITKTVIKINSLQSLNHNHDEYTSCGDPTTSYRRYRFDDEIVPYVPVPGSTDTTCCGAKFPPVNVTA
jgi:hypothetical protein